MWPTIKGEARSDFPPPFPEAVVATATPKVRENPFWMPFTNRLVLIDQAIRPLVKHLDEGEWVLLSHLVGRHFQGDQRDGPVEKLDHVQEPGRDVLRHDDRRVLVLRVPLPLDVPILDG